MRIEALRRVEYDEIVLDEEFGPVPFTVDDYWLKAFMFSVDDYNPWYLVESPFGPPVAPASALASLLVQLFLRRYDVRTDGGIQVRQELELAAPVFLGQEVVANARFVEKYVKRGRPFVVGEGELHDSEGKLLMKSRSVEMVAAKPGAVLKESAEAKARARASSGSEPVPPSGVTVDHARPGLAPGTQLPQLEKLVTHKRIITFSGNDVLPGGWANMHTDEEQARSVGLEQPLAQGLMTAGLISDLCTRFFGRSWFESGRLNVAFLKPVYAGAPVFVDGIVAGESDEGDGAPRLELDVRCTDPNGELVSAGRCSALADA